MSATSRGAGRGLDAQTVLLWLVLGVLVAGVGLVDLAVHAAQLAHPGAAALPGNPVALVVALGRRQVPWTTATTVALGALVAVGMAIGGLTVAVWARRRGRRTPVDRAARHLGRGRALAALTTAGASASADRLGVAVRPARSKGPAYGPGNPGPGLPVARHLASGAQLWSSWEDVSVDVWGPRTGKTTSRAIPAVLAAPGSVLATSNKRDLVDATRDLRAAAGRVWVFDPQAVVGEQASWWWDPLSYVTDEVKATSLARLFAAAAREPGARTDAYFDKAATSLLGNLLLAAATAGRAVTQVYLWLTDPTDDEPALLLHRAGYELQAAAVTGVVTAPDKQRAGVYGTAAEVVSFLTSVATTRWVTDDHSRRAPFDPAAFVASAGEPGGAQTLYCLSREGEGSAGPLVTALTVAVTEAAEALARRSPGGRLVVPLVAVLDEAANVCRWHSLPDLYSHYGSRGITMMTILQSWSQGVDVWGRDGMRKLWSAANVRVYGGGVSEGDFLAELSQLAGDFDAPADSVSSGKGGRSTSRGTRRERVLDVADLAALPRGRAVLFASGAPATLVRTVPWTQGPHAAAIRASIAAHDPAAASLAQEGADATNALTASSARGRAAQRATGNPWLPEPPGRP